MVNFPTFIFLIILIIVSGLSVAAGFRTGYWVSGVFVFYFFTPLLLASGLALIATNNFDYKRKN